MSLCTRSGCNNKAPLGWSYCSDACLHSNVVVGSSGDGLAPKTKLETDMYDHLVGAKQLSARTGYHYQSLMQWARDGKIPIAVRGKPFLFDEAEVLKAIQEKAIQERGFPPPLRKRSPSDLGTTFKTAILDDPPEEGCLKPGRDATPSPPPEPFAPKLSEPNAYVPESYATSPIVTDRNSDCVIEEFRFDSFKENVRKTMLEAAKQAARDVVIEFADQAKKSGNHELRAELLDDFIHMEESLKVVFQEAR